MAFDIETEDTGKKKCTNLTGPGGGPLLGLWSEEEQPLTGTVARWRVDKGFGFIKPDNESEEDVFCHRSVVQVRERERRGMLPVLCQRKRRTTQRPGLPARNSAPDHDPLLYGTQVSDDMDPALNLGEQVQYVIITESGRTKAGKVTGANGRYCKGVPKGMMGACPSLPCLTWVGVQGGNAQRAPGRAGSGCEAMHAPTEKQHQH